MLRPRSRADKAKRQAHRAERAATLRELAALTEAFTSPGLVIPPTIRVLRAASARARSPMPRRRATPRRSSYFRDDAYLDFVRSQPCAIAAALGPLAGPCSSTIDPDHQREGVGMGQRSPDPCAYPACRDHHDDRHNAHGRSGVFAHWTLAQLNSFIRDRVAESQRAWYGRALDDADLAAVRAHLESGQHTRGLFLTAAPRRTDSLEAL